MSSSAIALSTRAEFAASSVLSLRALALLPILGGLLVVVVLLISGGGPPV
jgi:hypothetical protein